MTAVARTIDEVADQLVQAQLTRTPRPPIRTSLPDKDIAAAYAVQRRNADRRVQGGAALVGRKIGLTHPAVQAQLGVDQPDFGELFSDMERSDGSIVDTLELLQPRIEAEIAFALSRDLDSPDIDANAIVAATAYVQAALEIVDSRIAGWDITIVDTVADNASAGLFVRGGRSPIGVLDLARCTMEMHRGAELVSSGRGDQCLGDPLNAMAWLANACRELGQPLRAGEVVLSGALGPVVPVRPGDEFTARISEIGSVSVRFSPADGAR